MKRHLLLISAAFIAAAIIVAVYVLRKTGGELPPAKYEGKSSGEALYIGKEACAGCHRNEYALWNGSHHDLAMQEANDSTVLGDFNNTTFTYAGITSTFYKQDGKFFVRTDGPDGALQDYQIQYTFGFFPLQQYLVAFPGGRYQALSICWDSRPAQEGGQRWFHLYPDEAIHYKDPLHWSGPQQNWNYMCAECHSTNLEKNYSLKTGSYATTWSEIDVSCEACHGPGSRHAEWAQTLKEGKTAPEESGSNGLAVRLKDPANAAWVFEEGSPNARRSAPLASNVLIETCARCHSRRTVLSNDYQHGRPLLDTHLPRTLEEDLYYPDGQILDEVYVYGSFVQSKMFHQGVTCNDCHEPHRLTVYAQGNALCVRCHLPAQYDTPAHHFHKTESAGALCVECHMPAKNYMVVDPRRDHSIRIPCPDLSLKTGAPNACTQCHKDRSAKWAAEKMAQWYGRTSRPEAHYGEILTAGRSGNPRAEESLGKLANDPAQAGIVRATALELLERYPGRASAQTVQRTLNDPDPLVRAAAVSALVMLPAEERVSLLSPFLNDPVKAVRLEAVKSLAEVAPEQMNADQLQAFKRVSVEYINAEMANSERPEAHLNLGVFYSQRGQYAQAENSYLTAIRLNPDVVLAYVNLADLYRILERDAEGESLLREALERRPERAEVHHALGLLLVRLKRPQEALPYLKKAAELEPGESRYGYVYAVALNSLGETDKALSVLEELQQRHPYDRDVLMALIMFNRDKGAMEAARRYAQKFIDYWPQDPAGRQFLQQLEMRKNP